MKQGISIREFARRENVSDTLVRKALKFNRLTAFGGGSLDPLPVGSNWLVGNAKSANSANPNANPTVRTLRTTCRLMAKPSIRTNSELKRFSCYKSSPAISIASQSCSLAGRNTQYAAIHPEHAYINAGVVYSGGTSLHSHALSKSQRHKHGVSYEFHLRR